MSRIMTLGLLALTGVAAMVLAILVMSQEFSPTSWRMPTIHLANGVDQRFIDLYGTGPRAPRFVVGAPKTNSILGVATEALPYTGPGTERFAGAVNTFAALLDTAAGNSIYGLSGLTRQYASRGTATHEVDSHNKSGAAPSTLLPPDTSPGTLENNIIGLIINSGGDADASVGLYIGQGLKDGHVGTTQWAAAGIYVHPHASDSKQIVIGGDRTSTGEGLVVERGDVGTHIRMTTKGVDQPDYAVIYHTNTKGTPSFLINQRGDFIGNGGVFAGAVTAKLPSAGQSSIVCYNSNSGLLTFQEQATGCSPSSARYKEALADLSAQEALSVALALKPISYRYKAAFDLDTDTHFGFTAEQVEAIAKNLVTYESDGVTPRAVRYQEFYAIFAGAIQALKLQNDTLRQEIAQLKVSLNKR